MQTSTTGVALGSSQTHAGPSFIDTAVGFSQRDADPPSPKDFFAAGYPDNRVNPKPCRVYDARQIPGGASLAREGFELVKHKTAFADERRRDVLRVGYHAEMADLIKQHVGASRVVVSSTGLLVRYGARTIDPSLYKGPQTLVDESAPAGFAHVDYRLDEAHELAAIEDRMQGIPSYPYKRLVIMQTWRAVSPPPQDIPLAICDGRTVNQADISTRTGVLNADDSEGMETNIFHVGGVHFNPSQRWHYFPNMTADEVLLFTGFDSDTSRTSTVAHAAFDNRAVHPHAHNRESFEARFYVYFD